MLPLHGQVAIVTGGSGGIGVATCRRLAADGARVAVLDLDQSVAADVASALPHGGIGVRCDISAPDEVAAAVDEVVARLGSIEILVNNAGMMRNRPFLEMSRVDWDLAIAANLTGPFDVTRAVGAVMADRGYGRITFVSSLAALGNPNQANYASAKAGTAGLAKTVAMELGEFGVTCNVVSPGRIDTAMLRAALRDRGLTWEEFEASALAGSAVKRIGRAQDVAAAVAFFSLPENGYVTGQTLYVTGSPVV